MAAGHNLIAAQRYLIEQRDKNRTTGRHTVWLELVLGRLSQVQEYACQE